MPQAIPFIAVALSVVGTGVGVYSAVSASSARQKQEEFNAAVAANAAQASRAQALFEVDRIREKSRRLRASQTAAASKAGIELGGSFFDIQFDSGVQEELEVMTAFYKGQLGSNTFTSQQIAAEQRGKAAQSQGLLTAIGTGLTGAGSTTALAGAGFNRAENTSTRAPSNVNMLPDFGDS